MKVYDNFMSAEDLEFLEKDFVELYNKGFFRVEQYFIEHQETIEKVFNETADRLTQQIRCNITSRPAGHRLREILKPIVDIPRLINIYYVRSFYPIGLHTDTNEREKSGTTYMIPLTYNTNIKTIAWHGAATNEEFKELSERFINHPEQFEKKSNISEEVNLTNCWVGDRNIVDYLDIEGVASWERGSVVAFPRAMLHASNNYKKIVDYKDYILIHNND